MIVIPGSKNTIGDLRWLKSSGLADTIIEEAKKGTPIFGVCGGFQILGSEIADPFFTEEGGTETGLSLLPIRTLMSEEKITKQFYGEIKNGGELFPKLAGLSVRGYEIHTGITELTDGISEWFIDDKEEEEHDSKNGIIGLTSGNVYGTYIHGIFDEKGIASEIIKTIARRKNIGIQRKGI